MNQFNKLPDFLNQNKKGASIAGPFKHNTNSGVRSVEEVRREMQQLNNRTTPPPTKAPTPNTRVPDYQRQASVLRDVENGNLPQ